MAEPLTPDELAVIRDGPFPLLERRLVATVDAERARANQAEAEVEALRSTMRQALDPCTTVNDAWRLLAAHVGWQDGRAATGDQP